MRGLPASGKSTRAKELLLEMGSGVRINKDLIRTMLHFDKFNGINESRTHEVAKLLAHHFLTSGVNVIIDDTNLNPRVYQEWRELGKSCEAKIQDEYMQVGVEECIMRDITREKKVGFTVIVNMALQYGIMDKSPYVLCDIDGTIADIKHRLQYAKGETKDWKKFFSLIDKDTVREGTRKLLEDYVAKGFTIIFVSARPDTYRDQTYKWLFENGLTMGMTLIMRKGNDKRPDTEVKKTILDTYFPDKSKIHAVIDDRPSVIRMWKENGLNVVDVGEGVEF